MQKHFHRIIKTLWNQQGFFVCPCRVIRSMFSTLALALGTSDVTWTTCYYTPEHWDVTRSQGDEQQIKCVTGNACVLSGWVSRGRQDVYVARSLWTRVRVLDEPGMKVKEYLMAGWQAQAAGLQKEKKRCIWFWYFSLAASVYPATPCTNSKNKASATQQQQLVSALESVQILSQPKSRRSWTLWKNTDFSPNCLQLLCEQKWILLSVQVSWSQHLISRPYHEWTSNEASCWLKRVLDGGLEAEQRAVNQWTFKAIRVFVCERR